MKLNQDIKAAILLALASISDSITINQYSMPKFRNSRIYTLKSNDGSIDTTINFAGKYNLDNDLQSTLEYLGKNEFGTFISQDTSDEETLKNTCSLLNSYKCMLTSLNAINPTNSKNETYRNKSITMANWWDTSSTTTKESKVLAAACAILYNLSEPSKNAIELSEEELFYKIIKEIAGFSEYLKDFKKEMKINWDSRKREPITAEDIKEESKLLTIATLTQLMACSFSVVNSLENTGCFKYIPTILDIMEKLNMTGEKNYYMHDREHKDKDLRALKKDIYSILFASLGTIDTPIKTMRKAEEYDNLIGNVAGTCYNTHALGSAYDMFEELYPTMDTHMQKVIQTLILNHASIAGVKVAGLPNIDPTDITYDRLSDITDINYEIITTPSKHHIAKAVNEIAAKEARKNRKFLSAAESLLSEDMFKLAESDETIEEFLDRFDNAMNNCFDEINKIREENGQPPINWGKEDDNLGIDGYPDIDPDELDPNEEEQEYY